MRRDYEENPPEGARDFRMDLPSNNPEKHFEYVYDPGLGDIVPNLEPPPPTAEPRMIGVYFGFDDHHSDEAVPLSVLQARLPSNVEDFVRSDEVRFPELPDKVKPVLMRFLYTGELKRPKVNASSTLDELYEAFEIMFHLNAAGCYSAIITLTAESHASLWLINLYMSEEETKDIIREIQEDWPNCAPNWYKAFLADCEYTHVNAMATELKKPLTYDPGE
ncbi:hypothetical protein HYE68_000857 [Fusarium pseudograminearum]|nr:hypothetical protein HYE68_000857 [Fusarium pseudograminearum]